MDATLLVLALQTAALLGGGAYLWRRQSTQNAEIARLRTAVAELQNTAIASSKRAASGEVVPLTADMSTDTAAERAARLWSATAPSMTLPVPAISVEMARGLTLGVLALAPALGFAFGADVAVVVASGLAIGAAMMTIAHRAIWRAAAWAGVATAGAWALIGFALGSAHADPISYSITTSLAAAAGMSHVRKRRAPPGVTMALVMLAATLALGSQIGMVSAAGVAFASIAITAAMMGATTVRLETLHLLAFAAALIGLYVLSGQPTAAIWFTPAAAWAGAVFLAITAVRVPQIGARGAAIAGTGVVAPIAAVASLHAANQGLANPLAAAAAFASVAALIGGIIAAAALRRKRGLGALKTTLWILALGASTAAAAAVWLALPAPLAATAFAFTSLALLALDARTPSPAWRAFSCICAVFAAIFAALTGHMVATEGGPWPAYVLIAVGIAAPAFIVGVAAALAKRWNALNTAGFLELVAIGLAVALLNLAIRLVYSRGALILTPISFAELGAHASAWIGAAMLLRWRARAGMRQIRIMAANTLLVSALGIMLAGAAFWITPYWSTRHAAIPALSRDTYGFLAPGLILLASWRLWRTRFADFQARLSLGAGALMLAAFVTSEALNGAGAAWVGAVIGAFAFALAAGVNFAPGVTRERR